MKYTMMVIALVLVTSCGGLPTKIPSPFSTSVTVAPPKQPEPPVEVTPPPSVDDNFHKSLSQVWDNYFVENYSDTRAVDVLVISNRKLKADNFGCTNDQLGVELDSVTHFGACKINVPKNHSTGLIAFTKDNRQSSHEFFKILNAKSLTEASTFEYLKKSERYPLVFVHGFNLRYEDAVLRASQIAFDLKYQGPIVLFSWPAGAGDGFLDNQMITRTYDSNFKNAKNSIGAFKAFLNQVRANNLKINLVVHSMGHQIVLPALKDFALLNPNSKVINELILNAPDYEANEFINIADSVKQISKRITVYCSYNDRAMTVSEIYNKNPRFGACAFSENIDSVNVSLIDAPSLGLGHGYYSSRAILADVFQVLLGIDAEKRLFMRKSEPNSTEKYFLRQ
ncbi:alpha/beta hydrolase [Cellvibrio sp.]|uniref:alpha/beta hydrolase n=1 Tax=Cellvibrio sp. TaxID=1965322 RepID=UPI0039648C45